MLYYRAHKQRLGCAMWDGRLSLSARRNGSLPAHLRRLLTHLAHLVSEVMEDGAKASYVGRATLI